MSGDKEAKNRGHALEIGDGGDVKGSGAAAGGGGGPEDYASDPQGGGGNVALPGDDAGESPTHN